MQKKFQKNLGYHLTAAMFYMDTSKFPHYDDIPTPITFHLVPHSVHKERVRTSSRLS